MSSDRPISILLVEDHALLRMGIRASLSRDPLMKVVGEAENGSLAIERIDELNPDVVVMDIGMPVMDGIESTRIIKSKDKSTRIIMLTSHDEDKVVQSALASGANGYCLKDIDAARLCEAIKAVFRGDVWLDAGVADKVMRCFSGEVTVAGAVRADMSDTSSRHASNGGDPPFSLTELERKLLIGILDGCNADKIADELGVPSSIARTRIVNIMSKAVRISGGQESREIEAAGSIAPAKAWLNSNNDSESDIDESLLKQSTSKLFAQLKNKYECLGLLGRGGMSIVYKARHTDLDKLCAIKFLDTPLLSSRRFQERFKREAQLTSRLIHANIISIYDFGSTDNGLPYLVMEYADGPSLEEFLKRSHRMDFSEAGDVFYQLAQALAFAHGKGVVHRDVKPGNVIMVGEESRLLCKLLDFGLAKFADEDEVDECQKLTRTGQILGSPLYMSPEQCRGVKLDQRSDIYSLGCLMYEVLTGDPPLVGKNAIETMNMHVEVVPELLDESICPRGFSTLIARCLDKDPQTRLGDANEICIALTQE